MNSSLPHPHSVHTIHLLSDQMIVQHRGAKGLQPLLWRQNDLGVLQGVMKIIRFHKLFTMAVFPRRSNQPAAPILSLLLHHPHLHPESNAFEFFLPIA